MSVLSNITELHFINKTNYYIEIHFSGEQQSKITILQKSENVISKISNIIEYIYSYFMGEEIDLVKIKLLPKQKEYIKIKCNANLFFQIHPTIKNMLEYDFGDFQLNTEYQNNKIEIELSDSFGIGYTEDGDVAINTIEPVSRDVCIHSRVYFDQEELNLEYKAAFCKIKL